jgi:hypothetical protein
VRHAHHVFSPCLHQAVARFSGVSTPPRLGQDHPREAPPVGDTAPVDVVLEVVSLVGGEIERAFLGELIEPGVIPRRQVFVGEVVEGEAPDRTAHRAELAVDRIVVTEPVELMQAASELADTR